MFTNRFPYVNFHELNLDWILKTLKKAVFTVNGLEPDENGNVDVPQISGTTSVNNVFPDGSGNVTLTYADIGPVAETVNNVSPDATGNVTLDYSDIGPVVETINGTAPDSDNDFSPVVQTINGISPDGYGAISVTTDFAVVPQTYVSINNQTEFEEFLDKINKGTVNPYGSFDTAGTYKINLPGDTTRLIFTSIQLHLRATVDNVILDMNGAIFYTSHINFTGVTKSLGDIYTFRIRNTNANIGRFEGCTILMTFCTIEMLLRLWSCYTRISTSRFKNDEYISSFTTSVDVIQGVFNSHNNYYDYDYTTITDPNFAIIGCGSGPVLGFAGRTAVRNCDISDTNIHFFGVRENIYPVIIRCNSGFYNIGESGQYNGTTRKGYIQPCTDSTQVFSAIFSLQTQIDTFGYMMATGTTLNINELLPATVTF